MLLMLLLMLLMLLLLMLLMLLLLLLLGLLLLMLLMLLLLLLLGLLLLLLGKKYSRNARPSFASTIRKRRCSDVAAGQESVGRDCRALVRLAQAGADHVHALRGRAEEGHADARNMPALPSPRHGRTGGEDAQAGHGDIPRAESRQDRDTGRDDEAKTGGSQ